MVAEDATTSPAPSSPDFDLEVSGIAALGDPQRRALYRYVISRAGPVNRDQVAEGAGVARHVVKFHLDRLADEGLLAVEYARPPGRRGPGAGRPAKLYRRSARELAISLPQRDYQLAGRLLARAVTDAEREGIAVGRRAPPGGAAHWTHARRPSPACRRSAADTDGPARCRHGCARRMWIRAPRRWHESRPGELSVPRTRRGVHRPRLRDEPRAVVRAPRWAPPSRPEGPPRTYARAVLRPRPHDRRSSSRAGAPVAVLS